MIIDFLKTKSSKKKLSNALDVLREFKSCESNDEWMAIPFVTWVKLEQLREYLEHLVDGKPLEDDTIEFIRSQNDRQ